jgi:hypothetical protein
MDIDDNESKIEQSIRLSTLFAFATQKEVRRNYHIKNGYFQIIDIKKDHDSLYRLTLSDTYDYSDNFYILLNDKNKQYLERYYIIDIGSISIIKEKDKPVKFFIMDIVGAEKNIRTVIDNPLPYGCDRTNFTSPPKLIENINIENNSSSRRYNGNLSITFDEDRNRDRPYTFTIFQSSEKKKRSSTEERDKENRMCRSAAHLVSNISLDSKRKRAYLPLGLISGLTSQVSIKVRLQNWKLHDKFKKYLLHVIDEDCITATVMVKEDVMQVYRDILKDFKTYYISGNYRLGGNPDRKILLIMESNVKIERAEAEDEIPMSKNSKITIDQIEDLYVQGITMCDMFLFVVKVDKIENGDEFRFARVGVSDSSQYKIDLLISKEQFEHRDITPGKVLFVTDIIIHFDNGYFLTTYRNSIIEVDLDIAERYRLKADNSINKQYIEHKEVYPKHKSLIKTVLIKHVLKRGEEKRKFERFDNLFVKAKIKTIVHKPENVYRKCKDCKRSTKLTDDNKYVCESKHVNINPEYAYCLKITLLDISGRCDVVLYNDIAQKLLDLSAHEYYDAVKDIENKSEVLHKAACKIEFRDFYFLIRVGYKGGNSLYPVELNLINFEEFDGSLYTEHLVETLTKQLHI